MKRFQIFQCWLILIIFTNTAWCADKISGSACYTYGDNESLVQAEQTTKTLAIRNAVESYSLFVEATTQVTDFQLSADLINTVTAGQVKNVKVLKHLQSGRKLCYTVEGFVEASELKIAIAKYLESQINAVQLQDNGYIKLIGQPRLVKLCSKLSPDKKDLQQRSFFLTDDEKINDEGAIQTV